MAEQSRSLKKLARDLWERRDELEDTGWAVGGPLLSVLFWAIFMFFIVGLWLSPILPLGDYNYHLALAAALKRMASPTSIERQLYDTNLFTYNSGFYLLVAGLGFVMPIDRAGLVVFTGCWLGLALGTIAVLRALKQPTERAFIVFPIFLCVPFAWGFVNFCVALAVHLWILARIIRAPRTQPVPIGYACVTALLGIFGMMSHLMAAGIGLTLAFAALVVRTYNDPAPTAVSFLRTIREGLPLVPANLLALAISLKQSKEVSRYEDKFTDVDALTKVKQFFRTACDFYFDSMDVERLKHACMILCVLFLFRKTGHREKYPTMKAWLFGVITLFYFILPSYGWRVAVLRERIPMIVVLFFAFVIPRANGFIEKLVAAAVAVVGMQCAYAWWELRRAQLPELKALEQVVDESPPRRRLALHVAGNLTLEKQMGPWAGHLAPYYVARKGIESAVNYAGIPSNPVRYHDPTLPMAGDNVAQGVAGYHPEAPYARRFDLVLVRAMGESNPAPALWGAKANLVQLVSHHGTWWMFDARGYFEHP